MKILYNAIRFLVGITFIISGLVKINDLVGFSFKLEEYFSPSVFNIPFLSEYTIFIGLFVCVCEVILGTSLLLKYKIKATLMGLLLLEIFFAFLTFYSAYYNKVTDCGCFGDAIKFTPWQSFLKDIFLLISTIILFNTKNKTIIPHKKISRISLLIVFFSSLILAYYTYNHLPIIDFRPYRVGVNIEQDMTIDPNAPQPIIEYIWHFEKNAKNYTIKTSGDYPTTDGNFVSVETHQISEGYSPPIHDFSIESDTEDLTLNFLRLPKLAIIVVYNVDKSDKNVWKNIETFATKTTQNGYTVIGLSATPNKVSIGSVAFYFCDETTLKTMIRSNPGVILLENGTIKHKIHYNDILSFKL